MFYWWVNMTNNELYAIFNDIIVNIEKAIDSLGDPEKTRNKAELLNFMEDKEKFFAPLLQIPKEKKLQTDSGKIYYSELIMRLTKLKRDSRATTDFNKIWVEIFDVLDYVELVLNKIKKIPYNHAGITIMGFGIILIPFYNLISIALGGYLLYCSDYRGKIAGTLMILTLMGYFLGLYFMIG